jgi:hypothetical protein
MLMKVITGFESIIHECPCHRHLRNRLERMAPRLHKDNLANT